MIADLLLYWVACATWVVVSLRSGDLETSSPWVSVGMIVAAPLATMFIAGAILINWLRGHNGRTRA